MKKSKSWKKIYLNSLMKISAIKIEGRQRITQKSIFDQIIIMTFNNINYFPFLFISLLLIFILFEEKNSINIERCDRCHERAENVKEIAQSIFNVNSINQARNEKLFTGK